MALIKGTNSAVLITHKQTNILLTLQRYLRKNNLGQQ